MSDFSVPAQGLDGVPDDRPLSALGWSLISNFCPLSLMNVVKVLLSISDFSVKMGKHPQGTSSSQNPRNPIWVFFSSEICPHRSSLPYEFFDAITQILFNFVQSFHFLSARKLVQIIWSSITGSETPKFVFESCPTSM